MYVNITHRPPEMTHCSFEIGGYVPPNRYTGVSNPNTGVPLISIAGQACDVRHEGAGVYNAASTVDVEAALAKRAAFLAAHGGGTLACREVVSTDIHVIAPELATALNSEQLRLERARAALVAVVDTPVLELVAAH